MDLLFSISIFGTYENNDIFLFLFLWVCCRVHGGGWEVLDRGVMIKWHLGSEERANLKSIFLIVSIIQQTAARKSKDFGISSFS